MPALTTLTGLIGGAGQHLVAGVPYSEAIGSGALYVVAPQNARSVRENVALNVWGDNNGSGDWTGGNAANTLKVTVYYVVEAV